MGCCSTRAQVRHTAPVVFPVDFDGVEHVYLVHPINVQLLTDPGDNAGQWRTRMTWFWFRKSWQTRATWHLALSCWKTWSKFRCFRKGRTIGSRISSLYFTAFNVPWTILSWVQPSWQIPVQTITLPPPKRSDSSTHWSIKRSPRLRYTRLRPSLKQNKNRDSSLKRMCCQVWSFQRRRARAQASLAIQWRCSGLILPPGA